MELYFLLSKGFTRMGQRNWSDIYNFVPNDCEMIKKGLFYHIGQYFLLMSRVFAKPEKHILYYKQFLREIEGLGINSFGIIAIISAFMGAVITIQTAYDMTNPLLPHYLIGVTARDSILLEFSSTMVALILAGKVGSSIASELGTMRIT